MKQVVALSHAAGGADLVGSIICRARHLHGAHAEEQHHAQHDGSDDRRHDEDALPDAGIDPAARAVPRALRCFWRSSSRCACSRRWSRRCCAACAAREFRSGGLRRGSFFLVFHGVHPPSVGLVSVL